MPSTVVDLLLEISEFFYDLVALVVTQFLYIIIVIVDIIISDVLPLLLQIFLYVLKFILVMAGLVIKSVNYILFYLYEAVVQLDWHYVALKASECINLLAKGTMLCGNAVIGGVEFLFGLLWSLLTYPATYFYNFFVTECWSIAQVITDAMGTSIGGREDWEMLAESSLVSSRTIKSVVTFGVYCVLVFVTLAVVMMLVKMTSCFDVLLQLMKKKFSVNAGQHGHHTDRPKRTNASGRRSIAIETRDTWSYWDNDETFAEHQKSNDEDVMSVKRRKKSISPSPPNDLEQEKLKVELDELKKLLEKHEEEKQCAVCYENPRTMVVYPCNHYCLCEQCRGRLSKCPICNKRIEFAQKIFNV